MTTERVALITGASSGFGLLTSITLATRGWRVLATMRDLERREKLEAAALAAEVAAKIEVHALDVTDAELIAAMADLVTSRGMRIDAVINNAGFALAGFAEDTTDAELRRQFETNFFGAAAATRAFLPQMRRQGSGHIVMISSVSGRMGFPGLGNYCASKFALEAWTETLRMEVRSLGIQVVLIEPGPSKQTSGAAIPSLPSRRRARSLRMPSALPAGARISKAASKGLTRSRLPMQSRGFWTIRVQS